MLKGKIADIRPLESSDLDWFTEWNNNPDYTGPFEPLEINSRDNIEKWHNSEKKDQWWVIMDKQENPVGQLVSGPQGDYYWLGYIVHPDHRNKGYATDAVKILVDYLFRSKNIIRIQAECNPNNMASIKVLENVGFTKEGLKRKAIYIQGKYLDSFLYSILRGDWKKQ